MEGFPSPSPDGDTSPVGRGLETSKGYAVSIHIDPSTSLSALDSIILKFR